MSQLGGADAVAGLARRLAVLLAAGTAPASAWQHVAGTDDALPRTRVVAESVAAGEQVAQAIIESGPLPSPATARTSSSSPSPKRGSTHPHDDGAWLALAAAWRVASDAGAPLAGTLEAIADALRDVDLTEREMATALSGPAATSRLVMVLPVVGLLFGFALGFDTFTVLATTPAGWACAVIGLGLLWSGRRWSLALLERASRRATTPGLTLDLLAIGVGGGGSIERAKASAAEALEHCGLPSDEIAVAEQILELSRKAGVPAAGLLRAEAAQQRSTARSKGARAAAKLGVTLMLPLGLCVLPAFITLGVVPLMIAVITSSLGVLPA